MALTLVTGFVDLMTLVTGFDGQCGGYRVLVIAWWVGYRVLIP